MDVQPDASPLRILVVVNVFQPDLGGGVLFSDLCYGLAARGFDVTVRCAYPYYPEWRDKSGKNGFRITRTMEQGVRVERYGLYIPGNPNALFERLLYEASFFLSLARTLPKRKQYDLIMVYCPLVGSVAYGALARLTNRGPLWLNVQDLSADAAAASGLTHAGFVTRLFSRIQRTLFNRADVWSSLSPVMIDRLKTLRVRNQPILYFPNWLHETLADTISAQPSKAGRLPGSPLHLLYSGNIGTKQDLLRFCKVLHTSDLAFRFRIQGGGSRAHEVQEWVDDTGDERFSFHPLSDESGLAQALHRTDFFVITEKAGSGGSFIPSKLVPGLASETPILAVCDGQSPLGREMSLSKPGPQIDWLALDTLPALLHGLADTPERYLHWQRNAIERSVFFARETAIERYAAALRSVIAETSLDPFTFF